MARPYPPLSPQAPHTSSSWNRTTISRLPDDPSHPVQIALRTYALSLSLSLGPSLLPFLISLVTARRSPKTNFAAFKRILRREIGHDSFAFAITFAVAGGASLRHFWHNSDRPIELNEEISPGSTWSILLNKLSLSQEQKSFLSYLLSSYVGIVLLQAGRRRSFRLRRDIAAPEMVTIPFTPPSSPLSAQNDRTSPTLDLTLLVLVRAIDSAVQAFILQQTVPTINQHEIKKHADPKLLKKKLEEDEKHKINIREKLTTRTDALVFWACSARIMWCFFYQPERLPRSYVKWINTLASVDPRLLKALRHLYDGKWSYLRGSPTQKELLRTYSHDLGYPASWGDPSILPAFGGQAANSVWRSIGVSGRTGVGGLPCEVVHGRVGSTLGLSNSCTANTLLRGLNAFIEAIAIYLPVHFVPILLTRPQTLLRPHRLLPPLLGALRSAGFLSSFVALYWYSICFTRSLTLAKFFPFISHDFWDGPYGCILAGSLMCGSSIWIENGRRRGEMALYVLPRAVRACLPDAWVKNGSKSARYTEKVAFAFSMSYLLTSAIHRPDSLRGLSRWTLSFITNGPNAGFWKSKRKDPSAPPTPSLTPAPFSIARSK